MPRSTPALGLYGPSPQDSLLIQQVREEQAESCGRALPRHEPTTPTAAEHLALIADALHVPRGTPWDELVQLVALRCKPMDRLHLDRLVTGSLRCAIHTHGPITHERICSAAKRIVGQIHAVLRAQHQGTEDPGQGTPRHRRTRTQHA
jgi:hypothetical protein